MTTPTVFHEPSDVKTGDFNKNVYNWHIYCPREKTKLFQCSIDKLQSNIDFTV